MPLRIVVLAVFLMSLTVPANAAALDFIQPSGSPYSTGELESNSVLTGDLNGDGRDDVVTANADYSYSIFLAGPTGVMTQVAGSPFSTGSDYAMSATLLKFTNDGNLDLAIASNNKVLIRPGLGDGTFGTPLTAITTNASGADMATGLIDVDGIPDIAVAGWSNDSVFVIYGDGIGPLTTLSVPIGDGPTDLVIEDFNRDGLGDLASANLDSGASAPATGAMSVMLNSGVGFFGSGSPLNLAGYLQPRGIASGDFNNDGDADLVQVGRSDRNIQVQYGNGAGGFTPATSAPDAESNWVNSVASADFDGDGFDDALVGMATNLIDPLVLSAPIFMGNSGTSLVESADGPWAATSPSYPWTVATGDFNGDGHVDWVSGDQGGRISVFMNEAPVLTPSPGIVDFGNSPVGTDAGELDVTLTNTGIGPVTVSGTTIGGTESGDFEIASGDCLAQTLDTGDECSITLGFNPAAMGSRSAALEVSHTGDGSPLSVVLRGVGAANPGISIDPATHDFGDARITRTDDATPQTFTVENTGTTQLDISAATLTGLASDQFVIESEDCSTAPIQPEETCDVVVDFHPTTLGAKSANLSFSTNVSGGPQTAGLSGTGTPYAYPDFQPRDAEYGPVRLGSGPSAPQVFTLTAMGPSPLHVDSIVIDPNNRNPEDFAIVSDTCNGQDIPTGTTCEVAVVFEPTEIGPRDALLRYYTPGFQGILYLTGVGIDPGSSLAPQSRDFGTRLTGEGPGEAMNFTLTSTGTTDLDAGEVSLTGAAANQFRIITDECSGSSIAPQETCDVSVAFAPTSAGEKAAQLTVPLGGGLEPATANLTGSGQGPVPPPNPCEPIAIRNIAYFTPTVRKPSSIPGVRARITTADRAVVRVSSKVIYRLNGKQGQIRFKQRQFTVRKDSVNYKVAIPKNLRKKLKPKKKVRFEITYASRATAPECTRFGENRIRSLNTRVVWTIPSG